MCFTDCFTRFILQAAAVPQRRLHRPARPGTMRAAVQTKEIRTVMTHRWLTRLALAAVLAFAALAAPSRAQDLENTLYLDLDYGRVVIALRPDLAPKHVARIKELTRQKFYDGLLFHRVIDN